jgi:hypothetical protein
MLSGRAYEKGEDTVMTYRTTVDSSLITKKLEMWPGLVNHGGFCSLRLYKYSQSGTLEKRQSKTS